MKKNITDRTIDATREMITDRKLGYEIPINYYAEKHEVPFEESKTNTYTWDSLSEEEKQNAMTDTIEINGRTFSRAFYEKNPVKVIRTAMNLTQAQFCKEFDIPNRTLTSWETGERKPADYIVKLLLRVVEK